MDTKTLQTEMEALYTRLRTEMLSVIDERFSQLEKVQSDTSQQQMTIPSPYARFSRIVREGNELLRTQDLA